MAGLRNLSDIVKGSALMVWVDDATIGFATSHTLSLSSNTTEINTKDNGDYPGVVVQNITWEVTAENLYSSDIPTLIGKMKAKDPVSLTFGEVAWDDPENGVIGDNGNGSDWTATDTLVEGEAIITSISINAAAGDNATASVTFTGTGPLEAAKKPTPSNP